MKILLTLAVIGLIYFIFFKPKQVKSKNKTNSKANETLESDDMVACETCDTYVRVDEAFIKNGNYYCSNECMNS
jgi:uncharacterized protein